MINYQKSVFDRLFKEESVELSKVDVELGLIQDIDALLAQKVEEYEKIQGARSTVASIAGDARNKLSTKIERVEALIIRAEQQFKELGFTGKSGNIEQAKKFLKGDKERLKKVQSFLSNLSKAQI
jgi:hypothetical protein